MRKLAPLLAGLALAVLVVGCGDDEPAETVPPTVEQPAATTVPPTVDQPPATSVAGCAHVIAAEAEAAGDGTYLFRVTVRSADTGPEKFADAWEVRAPDGTVLGTRVLLHDHVNEQPFTRTLPGVEVPAVDEVVIAARDSVAGFCGDTLALALG